MTTELSKTSPQLDGVLVPSGNPARDLARSFNLRVIFFLALQIPLAFVLDASPWTSTVYALLVLVYGLHAALLARTRQVLYAAAYLAGGEVIWRMTEAHLPWEYAKYATVLLVGVAIVVEWSKQRGERRIRSPWPLFLLLAMVPAIVITLLQSDLAFARDSLSFNLGGYLAFALMALYMWARIVDVPTATRLLLALIAPIVSICTLAIYNTITFNSDFLLASNWVTSGNYGPNQVSNVLGLAALACIMAGVLITNARGARWALIGLAVVLLSQAMLTFSRGGVYSFLLGFAVFGLNALQTSRARGRFLLVFLVGTAILVFAIFPQLNNYTGGALALRLAERDSTGRLSAAEADLQTFTDHPVAGVGVGLGAQFRDEDLVAHTEYTRLLAEHGIFGIGIFLILGWMLIKRYLANAPGLARGMAAGFAIWSLSIMSHSAMRLEVIPLTLALALLTWQVESVREAPGDESPDGRET